MNCRRVQALLSEHLEGHLIERDAAGVAAHLRDCPDCRRLREALEAFERKVRESARWQPAPERNLRRQAVDRWLAEQQLAPGWRHWLLALSPLPVVPPVVRHAITAAAGLALLGILFAGWRSGGGARTSLPPADNRAAGETLASRALHGPLTAGSLSRSSQLAEGRRGGLPLRLTAPSRELARHRAVGAGPRACPAPAFAKRQAPTVASGSVGEMEYVNGSAGRAPRPAEKAPVARAAATVWARVQRAMPVGDDFVQIPFPRLASASERPVAAAVESYKREAAVVDGRLSRELTVEQKGTALCDLCDGLRADTGIQLTAGQSVADEKVTLFCRKMPLREVMRQLSRPFGYTWLRTGKDGEYRYELVQDLRSQLLEEELRNRDRNEALLALDREIQRYRPYLSLTPDEALARSKTASPEEKRLLDQLGRMGWGPMQMYSRLLRQDLAALRAGQALTFSQEPKPGEGQLPPDLARGVLECNRHWRLVKGEQGFGLTNDLSDPRSVPLTADPDARAKVALWVSQSELGVFTLDGVSGAFPLNSDNWGTMDGTGTPLAVGVSPAVLKPDNAAANAKLTHDPALRRRVSLQLAARRPSHSGTADAGLTQDGERPEETTSEPRVTSADAIEALYRATGIPIVSDYYTRLYKPATLVVRTMPLFDALNRLADATRSRWSKGGTWLQFRSTSFYDDRLKEVPNRLLARWAASRREHGSLTLEDLVEIAQLPDAQLDASAMAEGARELWGLAEWDLSRSATQRPHLRYLAQFTPAQRQEAMTPAGLPFAKMSLAQQQRYISLAFHPGARPLESLEELEGAVLRVDYKLPGWFEWRMPTMAALEWVVPVEPGRQGRRVLRPSVRGRTREVTLEAVRRFDPQLREALAQALKRADPRLESAAGSAEPEIAPTRLSLTIIYIPGLLNNRPIHVLRARQDLTTGTGW